MKTLLLAALLPLAMNAQLAIYAVNGSTETPVGSTYQFGQIALNTTASMEFQIYNQGSTAVTIATMSLSGAGFKLTPPPLPVSIPANSTQQQAATFAISFTPTSTATYSAFLQVGSLSVLFSGSGVMAPTLTSVSGCSSSAPFSWGGVPVNSAIPCTFALQNLNPEAVNVPSVTINGLGFTGPYGITAPLTIQPNQSISFSVNFTPLSAIAYTGFIAVGAQSYPISGTGQPALLPKPALTFDSSNIASAQQRILTMTIPGGSPIAATGYVNLAFAPSTAVVKDDASIVFLANGSRSIPFSVAAGATNVLLNGQSSATFQTGTTEGTLTFSVSTAAAMTGDPTTELAIPGAAVTIASATANKERTGYLDITITGADNTYSAGAMMFSFFDTSGKAIGSTVSTDFTSQFKTYYSGDTAGSTFESLISFPVTGSVATIGSVTVTLTNAAGVISTGSLTFQ